LELLLTKPEQLLQQQTKTYAIVGEARSKNIRFDVSAFAFETLELLANRSTKV
jgi:hypothetical protein